MRLSDREFQAMSHPFRQWLQRMVEFPQFRRMGLAEESQDILEIGCGSGYGAVLLAALNPRSYIGVDLMPEQIALAQQRHLANAAFVAHDAADLRFIADASKDVVVIFGVLHHIPAWREVVRECYRALRPAGRLFVEEPDGALLQRWDQVFHWGHPATFGLAELEACLSEVGFVVEHRRRVLAFGIYRARRPA
jgi:SAM-dependent methyltransferase